MESHRVPQQTSLDEPIMFDFTIKESVIMLIFGALAYLIMFKFKVFLEFRIILAVICIAAGFGLAKIKPLGRALDEWVFIVAIFRLRPKKRVWREVKEINISDKLNPLNRLLKVFMKRENIELEVAEDEEEFKELDDRAEQIKGIFKDRDKLFWVWKRLVVEKPKVERAEEGILLVLLNCALKMEQEGAGEEEILRHLTSLIDQFLYKEETING